MKKAHKKGVAKKKRRELAIRREKIKAIVGSAAAAPKAKAKAKAAKA